MCIPMVVEHYRKSLLPVRREGDWRRRKELGCIFCRAVNRSVYDRIDPERSIARKTNCSNSTLNGDRASE